MCSNLFWVGDFNYRIDLPDEFVRERIANEDWDTLWNADQVLLLSLRTNFYQLYHQQRQGKVFVGWQEAPINFAPTYKYDSNSTQYDTGSKVCSQEKIIIIQRRCPAWCDRIMWKSNYATNKTYERFELLSSDHRPVAAKFTVGVSSF